MQLIRVFLIFILLLFATKLFAQTSGEDSVSHSNYLRVYIDGITDWQDYVKVKMWYADYVRDPNSSQVQIIISKQSTASGGARYTLFFLGKEYFTGKNDTLSYTSPLENTNRQTRDEIANEIEMGLMPYFAANGQ